MKKLVKATFNILANATVAVVFRNKMRGKVLGRSYILRKRLHKDRYEISKGECFRIVHCCKWAFYIEHKQGRMVGFDGIQDRDGQEIVTNLNTGV